MEDEPSFPHDLHWSMGQSAENQPPVEESPLIGEGEPLLTRPASSNTLPVSERSVRSLASLLSNVQISTTNPFVSGMEGKESVVRTPDAPVPPVISLPSSSPVLEPLSAEYIADRSIPDGQVVAPGAEFLKAWVMRNGGSRPWPEDTELVFVAGESLAKDSAAMQPKLIGAVQPMEQIDLWTGELKAPESPGRYVSYYRLRDGEGNLFGHSIWLDITVSETHHRSSPDTLASSEEYMSSSSIIVMPHNASSVPVHDGNGDSVSSNSSMPGSPITAPSNDDDEISDNDSETSGSLLSVPDSDSDEELWQDSRTSVLVEGGDSQATLRALMETQQQDEYVVLYDETTSSEEGE
jgi:next-to-BRCA1 protein 1